MLPNAVIIHGDAADKDILLEEGIENCSSFVSLTGDRINLKSKLTQYLSMANIFSNGYIKELDLVAHDKEDVERLIKFMYQGE